MASIKDLKKEVKFISNYYIEEAALLQELAPVGEQEKIAEALMKIYDLEEETVVAIAAHRTTQEKSKDYFSKLIKQYDSKLDDIIATLEDVYKVCAADFTAASEAPAEA